MGDGGVSGGWWNGRYVAWALVISLGLLAVLIGPHILAAALVVAPRFGNQAFFINSMFPGMFALLIFLATPVVLLAAIGCAIVRPWRPLAIPLTLAAIVFAVGFNMPASAAHKYRMARIFSLAESSAPLVEAIHRFERETGAPPTALADLAPDYLPAVPGTGLSGYPAYAYVSRHDAEYDRARWQDNDWALYVDTPSALINWDMFLYLPRQNYPERGFGGRLERVGAWAYVDE